MGRRKGSKNKKTVQKASLGKSRLPTCASSKYAECGAALEFYVTQFEGRIKRLEEGLNSLQAPPQNTACQKSCPVLEEIKSKLDVILNALNPIESITKEGTVYENESEKEN